MKGRQGRRHGRRSKADVAITLMQSELGQQILDIQAAEIARQIEELEHQAHALRLDLDAVNRLRTENGKGNGEAKASRRGSRKNGRVSSANGRKGKRGARKRPDPEAVVAALTDTMKDRKEGLTIGEIAKLLDQRTERLRPVLLELIDDKRVTKRGERRATRYSVS